MTELRTERLRLRHFTPDDVQDMFELDSDPEVIRYGSPQYLDTPGTIEDARAMTKHYIDERANGSEYWAAEEHGDFVGWFFLRPNDDGEWELGYRLKQAAWGRGLATEGARAVLKHGFATLGLDLIYAEVFVANARSHSVMAKLGMKAVSEGVFMGMPDRRYEIRK